MPYNVCCEEGHVPNHACAFNIRGVCSSMTSNSAGEAGGGLGVVASTGSRISSGTVVSNNAAPKGGGVGIISSSGVAMSSCTLSSNTATDGGGAVMVSH